MKNLRFLISIITSLTNGMFKVVNNLVIPIIRFVDLIKALIEDENFSSAKKKTDKDSDEKTDWILWIIEKLSWSKEIFDKFSKAFLAAARKLLPDIITATTFLPALKQFVEHLRTLNSSQKAFLFLKLASLMLISLAPDKKYQEAESDFIIQLVYTREKLLNNI
jgi:hypothetical protein